MNWIDGVGVRPEAMRISRELPSAGSIAVFGVVTRSVFLGACMHVTARRENGETLLAQIPPECGAFLEGEAVHLWWSAADELRFS